MPGIELLFIALGCGEPYHSPDDTTPTFVLPGPHLALTCEACHGAPPYQAFVWDTTCLSCHEADRKDATHYAGRACSDPAGCHADTDATWADNDGVPHDFLPLEGVHQLDCTSCHGSVDPSNDDVFPAGGSRYSCAGCHDVAPAGGTGTTTGTIPGAQYDRPLDHFVELDGDLPPGTVLAWDCNPCHDPVARGNGVGTVTGWAGGKDHGYIRFPHGTEAQGTALPPAAWVVKCADCHTDGPPQYSCTTSCHAEIFVEPRLPFHDALTQGVDTTCTINGCHFYADIRTIEGTVGIGPLTPAR